MMIEEHLVARVLIAFVFLGIATVAVAMAAHLGA
jgi:hypothetical protein